MENGKVKQVMQTTQDRALRRISELKEQSNLEKQAKMHLEEELRAELEEKQHVIDALSSKVRFSHLIPNYLPAIQSDNNFRCLY